MYRIFTKWKIISNLYLASFLLYLAIEMTNYIHTGLSSMFCTNASTAKWKGVTKSVRIKSPIHRNYEASALALVDRSGSNDEGSNTPATEFLQQAGAL
jgi:hypothetical protein